MSNVVRTVATFMANCKETEFQPISKSAMWRVLEAQDATQRKSLWSLKNSEGADGFRDFFSEL